MTDVLFVAILVAFFVLAMGVVQVLSRMLERDTDPDSLAEEPPDNGEVGRSVESPVRPR